MFKSVHRMSLLPTVFLLAACSAGLLAAQDAPPKDLVQYVREALKAGQTASQIQQRAVSSGWSAATVNQAVALVHQQDAAPAVTARSASLEEGSGSPAPKPRTGHNAAASSPSAAHDPTVGDSSAGGSKPSVSRGVPDDYKIGAGDILDVNVWKEPDASVRGAIVRTDGRISMPLLKDVDVVGLTPVEMEKLITGKLSSMINSPDVTVIITGTASKKIYVQGKVNHEGPISFNYNMTVMQALSEAGGITVFAKKSKIYVLRTENGKALRLPFDYSAVLKGQRLDTNVQLRAGDMIVVP